jgi:hypothetical protein
MYHMQLPSPVTSVLRAAGAKLPTVLSVWVFVRRSLLLVVRFFAF